MVEGSNRADHLALDVHWTSKYKTLLLEDSTTSPNTCIFRIPAPLKRQNRQAYEPYFFSLGPWHFRQPHLMDAQKYKMNFLEQLVGRFPISKDKIKELEEIISEVLIEASECYGGWGAINVESREEFGKILLLDGCFVIEMLRKSAGLIRLSEHDQPIFSNAMNSIWYHDLFLIENQIPWFVLERLYESIRVSEQDKPLVDIAIDAFFWIFSYDKFKLQIQADRIGREGINHILDLAWHYLGWSSETECKDFRKNRHNIPSASRLREAGVKFRRSVESRRILDVRFNKTEGVLEIPSLLIHPTTETLFRNLISYEQCYRFYPSKVTCYAKLLNGLVDTPEDVDLLSRKDSFNNWLSPEDVSDFLNRLHNGTNMDCLYYARLCSDVRDYCKRWWPKWRAFYIHNYFTKPWAIISQIFAITILVLTILQVIPSWSSQSYMSFLSNNYLFPDA
ncbi:hypothetical protein SLEP1_g4600 [Rubroshorea leprosula]|uniref:Uncharacterized protein n=1 Tax=Rubroshorea leprosula TaxID=152421 RepID=A0AAV5HV10_9ROSI|nr:hypothetical protein SLEP1_g4600 [Rubroshorea leprosula]